MILVKGFVNFPRKYLFARNETQEQHSLLDTIVDCIFVILGLQDNIYTQVKKACYIATCRPASPADVEGCGDLSMNTFQVLYVTQTVHEKYCHGGPN